MSIPPPSTIVLGTHNPKKRAELAALLGPYGFELRSLADFPQQREVVEDGESFRANADLKSTSQARFLQHWVLGEDSGISVDALHGAPGIYSARFAGEQATDDQNNAHLLEQLAEVPESARTAHYTCHLSLSDPQGTVQLNCEAYCHGRIRFQPAGIHGFGYDPLFEIPEYHRTFGELGPAVKSVLSHRARAFRLFLPQLVRLHRQWLAAS